MVGLKPTHGLVPYTGIIGMDASFDHAGPMARSVADAALLLEVIAGKDPLDPRQNGVVTHPYTQALGANDLKGMRIGVLREGFGGEFAQPGVDAPVRQAIAAMEKLGAEIREASVPDHRAGLTLLMALAPEALGTMIEGNG